MAKKRYFYIKANRTIWNDKLNENNKNLDWSLVKNKESYKDGVLFSAGKMVRDYFEQINVGDVVILHSTHKANTQFDPEEDKEDKRFVPSPRIIGISVVNGSLHYAEGYREDKIKISTEDMLIFRKSISIRAVNCGDNEILKKAEPFKQGTNRFTLTELEDEEYSELKKLILSYNPQAKEVFEELENK